MQLCRNEIGRRRTLVRAAIESEDRGGTHVVTVWCELDLAGAEKVTEALAAIAGSTVVVNLEHLTFLDAAGLSALLSAWQQVQREGHRLRIAGARGIVRRVIDVTGPTTCWPTDPPGRRRPAALP